jgi:hypothetical protein
MTIRFNTATRNMMADALGASLASATLSIYTGTQPADPNSAATGTKLVDITINGFSAAATGSASLVTAPANVGTSVAAGTAGWGRVVHTGGTIDGSVGTSGTDFTINSTAISNGSAVTLTAMTIVQPAS